MKFNDFSNHNVDIRKPRINPESLIETYRVVIVALENYLGKQHYAKKFK